MLIDLGVEGDFGSILLLHLFERDAAVGELAFETLVAVCVCTLMRPN